MGDTWCRVRFAMLCGLFILTLLSITISPVSTAALGFISQERGLSLRFPRFIRIREDKGVMDASTPEFLAAMWRTQENRDNLRKLDTGGVDEGDLVDALSSTSEIEDEYDL